MKRLLILILLIFFVFHGISFLMFVLRMMWFPPSGMMGMMMGREMMYNHIFSWFNQTFWLFIMLVGLIIIGGVFRENRKK